MSGEVLNSMYSKGLHIIRLEYGHKQTEGKGEQQAISPQTTAVTVHIVSAMHTRPKWNSIPSQILTPSARPIWRCIRQQLRNISPQSSNSNVACKS
ncbi:hypothetical protein TNCV_3216861 [Trichonephila clavipes]|nr:hypothetical protein TNCV_3216861 [Trichonephila clavipes]